MFIAASYKVAPPLDTGTPRLIPNNQSLPFFDLDWTGLQVNRTLSPGVNGYVGLFNAAQGSLWGNIVPGMYTQPLTRG
jgi:hypothetical protein